MITFAVQYDPNLLVIGNAVARKAKAAVRMVASRLYSDVVSKSPVRSGKFRANWTIGVGLPNRTTTNSTTVDMSKPLVLARYEAQKRKDVFIGNFLPYAPAIEYGLYPPGPNVTAGYSRKAIGGVLKPSLKSLVRSLGI